MREVFIAYLDAVRSGDPARLCEARERFQKMFCDDYFLERKLWIKNHADEIEGLREKPVEKMTLHKVQVCLTNIVARERIFAAMSGCEQSGMTERLLKRYLELTAPDEKGT